MSSNYFRELEGDVKERYLEKLTFNNVVLPDPMDDSIRPYTFSRNVNLWPSVCSGNMYTYLVATVYFLLKKNSEITELWILTTISTVER